MGTDFSLKEYKDNESQLKSFNNLGYAFFKNVLSRQEILELRDAMDQLTPIKESFDRDGIHPEGNFFEKHIKCVFNRDPVFLSYVDRKEIIDFVASVVGHKVHAGSRNLEYENFHIIGMTAWVTGPGRTDQQLHCDWLPFPLPEDVIKDTRVKVPLLVTTVHYYLDNLFEDLGPTKFVPGSHLSGRLPNGDTSWNGQEEQSILCDAGDVLVFRSDVWHRGTANKSNQNRYLLQVHYANRMIAQKFPPYLNQFQFNQVILDQATPRQRRILGDHPNAAYD